MATRDGLDWTCETLTQDAVARLEPQWTALAAAASEPNMFLAPWFIHPSLAMLAKFDPKLVTIWHDDLLIGLLIVRGDRGFAKLPFEFLSTALHYEQYLGTPLVRAGYEARFAQGLFAWLDKAPGRYCLLHLRLVGADSAVAAALTAQCQAEGRGLMILNRAERAAISLPRPANASIDGHLSAARRKSLRRTAADLAKQGIVTRERLTDDALLEAWMADFLAMENSGWKHDGGSSILSCPDETHLYRAIVTAALAGDMLKFHRLCLNGQPIAYTLDIDTGAAVFCLKSAIDQNYKKYSPGVLAEYETLKTYLAAPGPCRVDSCTSPDNTLLNGLWPDKRPLAAMSVARKGGGYGLLFAAARLLKRLKYRQDTI